RFHLFYLLVCRYPTGGVNPFPMFHKATQPHGPRMDELREEVYSTPSRCRYRSKAGSAAIFGLFHLAASHPQLVAQLQFAPQLLATDFPAQKAAIQADCPRNLICRFVEKLDSKMARTQV